MKAIYYFSANRASMQLKTVIENTCCVFVQKLRESLTIHRSMATHKAISLTKHYS